jgi:hypothetical protein
MIPHLQQQIPAVLGKRQGQPQLRVGMERSGKLLVREDIMKTWQFLSGRDSPGRCARSAAASENYEKRNAQE